MKRKAIVLSMVLLVLLAGCSKSPSSVTKNFVTAIQKNDMGKIQANTTEKTTGVITTFAGLMRAGLGDAPVTVVKEQITGDTAVVTIKKADGKEDRINLIKEKGAWKVTIR
ncbi:MAG: DUF4878 domain-containing protein [Treponema sp.]|jgi:hypothetical protein|nr:DUF4878 domain-containing protein [Treponema sp.]